MGAGVDSWKIGDLITALVPGGGYAEFCVTPALHALPVPVGLSLAEAAGLRANTTSRNSQSCPLTNSAKRARIA